MTALWAVAVKELRQIARDRRTLMVLLIVPAFFLFLYGYALNFDIRHVSLAVEDRDGSAESRDLVAAFERSEYFTVVANLAPGVDAVPLLDRREARAALVIPGDYGERLAAGDTADVQVLIDGDNANTATTVVAYITAVVREVDGRVRSGRSSDRPALGMTPVLVASRVWYNPELRSTVFLVPGLIAFIAMITAVISTALSIVRAYTGDVAGARGCETEAGPLFRDAGHRAGEAISLLHLGQIEMYAQEDADARRHFEQCLALAREIQSGETESECEILLGQLSLDAGDAAGARARFERALGVCRESQDKRNAAIALWWLGRTDLLAGDEGAARMKLTAALRAFQASGMISELLGCLEDVALLLGMAGAQDAAARLLGAVEAARQRAALARAPRYVRRWTGSLSEARQSLGSEAFSREWAVGSAWELAEAVRFIDAGVAKELATL